MYDSEKLAFLYSAGVICKTARELTEQGMRLISKEINEAETPAERIDMLMLHLAMAIQRLMNGEEENMDVPDPDGEGAFTLDQLQRLTGKIEKLVLSSAGKRLPLSEKKLLILHLSQMAKKKTGGK